MVHARPVVGHAVDAFRFPRFEIHGGRCPQLLGRVVDIFAAQALIPFDLHARQSAAGLWIGLHVDVMPAHAYRLAERLRMIVSVETVILIDTPPALAIPAERTGAAGSTAERARRPLYANA